MRVLVLLLLLVGVCTAQPTTATLKDCAWLTGNWIGPDGFEEFWSAPKGKIMLGLSRAVVNEATIHREFLLLEETPAGLHLTLCLPNDNECRVLRFECREASRRKLTFIAPTEQLIYEQTAADELRIVLQRREGKVFDLHFRRGSTWTKNELSGTLEPDGSSSQGL